MENIAPLKATLSAQGLLLRLEGLAFALAACAAYGAIGGSWWFFALFILAPDLAMLGYAAGQKIGALCYNLTHTYLVPVPLALVGWYFEAALLTPLALIWIAHIGLDRAIGYGLKYGTSFHDTHLSRV